MECVEYSAAAGKGGFYFLVAIVCGTDAEGRGDVSST